MVALGRGATRMSRLRLASLSRLRRTRRLLGWARRAGILLHPAAALRRLPGAGLGLVATRRLPAGAQVLLVPESAMLRAADPDALILAVDRESGLGPHSEWADYLRALPRRVPAPVLWPRSEWAVLRGTEVADPAGERKMLRRHWRRAIRGRLPWRRYVELGTVLRGYGFSDGEGGPPRLIPMADMLNHHPTAHNCVMCDDQHQWCMRTSVAVSRGAQLFNHYADLSSAGLLHRCGFATRHSPLDTVSIDLSQLAGPAVLQALTPDELDDWPLIWLRSKQSIPQGLRLVAGGAAMPEREQAKLAGCSQPAVRDRLIKAASRGGWKAVARAVAERLSAYPTSLAEVETRLKQLDGRADLSGPESRERYGLIVRAGEQTILEELAGAIGLADYVHELLVDWHGVIN